jgi:iron-sulfur cluster assembly protein
MIHLTDSALSAVRTAIASTGEDSEGLRIMVEAGGCAGFKYMMGLVKEPTPGDHIFERDGVKVFVEESSLAYLDGTKVDFVIGIEGSGFTFDNPQAKSACSCGKSFG